LIARIQGTVRLAALAMLVASCGLATGSASSKPVTLGISNGTDLTVALFVNSAPVATYAPKSGDFRIDSSSFQSMPWDVQVRSASGRVLLSMNVTPDQVQTVQVGDVTSMSGSYARVDLSCGTLRIWAGDITPSGPAPDPSPGHVGDCLP
jgi:hypothetical protein